MSANGIQRDQAIAGTPPSTRAKSPIDTASGPEEVAPLTAPESKKLNLLGYGKDHIAQLSPDRARAIIANKSLRPGSRAYNNAQPAALRVSDSQTDEAIKERNTGKPAPSGIDILVDEYTQKCVKGDSPLDAVLNELQEAFPDDVVRLINPDLPPVAGPALQIVHRQNGERVEVGGLVGARIPRDIYEEAYVKPNNLRSRQMTGEVSNNQREDGDVRLSGEDARLAPTEGKGLHTEIHSGAF
jgi:hypothetical protein